jgi:predicted ferric reductase
LRFLMYILVRIHYKGWTRSHIIPILVYKVMAKYVIMISKKADLKKSFNTASIVSHYTVFCI